MMDSGQFITLIVLLFLNLGGSTALWFKVGSNDTNIQNMKTNCIGEQQSRKQLENRVDGFENRLSFVEGKLNGKPNTATK